MHSLVLIPLVSFLAACVVGSAILCRDPSERLRRIAAALVASGGLASALELAWNSAPSASLALLGMKLAGVATLLVGPLCMELACERWTEFDRPLRIARVLAAGTAAGLALLILETPRFVLQPIASEWGFTMRGGDLMWLTCFHTVTCVGLILWMLRRGRVSESDERAALRRNALAAGALLVAVLGLDLALSLQGVGAPRLAAPAIILLCAFLWRPEHGEQVLHPGAFDSEILDALSDGVVVLRDDGCIRAVNSSLEALSQVSRERLVDMPLRDLIADPPTDPSRASTSETTLLIDGDEGIPVSISSSPLRDRQGSVIGSAVAIRDRREVVDLQRHLVTSARFAAVGELAAGLAHEVNNPLAFIQANLNQMHRGYAEFERRLSATKQSEGTVLRRGETLIAECLDGIARVASIVREVRGFAHGGQELDRLCDVNSLLEAATRMAVPPERHAAELQRSYAELPAIVCREQDLKQLLLGLVMHAAQPSRNARHICVATLALSDGVRVCVEDDGVGYADAALDRIFEPSLDDGGGDSGEGMGLSIAYHIARQLGGEIEVESTHAGPTRVAVVLPCGEDRDPLDAADDPMYGCERSAGAVQ